jgi:DNA-binding XRE family transcriptional regulator
MTKPQTFKTPDGGTMVILPLADYEALIDAADLAAHQRAMAKLSSGRMKKHSAKEVKEMLACATPLAYFRKKSGRTQAELAAVAGISQNYLSALESGTRKGTVDVLKKLAVKLAVPLADLTTD